MSQRSRAESILKKKAAGLVLAKEDIYSIVQGVYDGVLAQHQLGAFLMAVYLKGMCPEETTYLTEAMMSFGERFHWEVDGVDGLISDTPACPIWAPHVVDKHSTGGVGDKVSIPLAPMVAACGAKVPMISGRGLGITGGTIDKLESIPGFHCEIAKERLQRILDEIGCFISSQSADLAPTDKVIYATRNETGTVASVPLITASIISKKGVEGLRGLVLDVKFGSGGFMKTIEEAEVLARSMIEVAKRLNIRVVALLDRMDCPLGYYVGNALEIYECVKMLQGELWESDLGDITLQMGQQMLRLAGIEDDPEKGLALCKESIASGRAMEVFKRMCLEQGVEAQTLDAMCANDVTEMEMLHLMGLNVAEVKDLEAPKSGVVKHIDALKVGTFCQFLGATKTHPRDVLDLACGVKFFKKPGDQINEGEPWVRVYHNKVGDVDWQLLEDSIEIADHFEKVSLIEKVLE